MKKTVFFTAAITFLSAIVCISAIYFIVAISSPLSAAKFWDGVGAYSLSAKYYERQYKKTENISDLLTLCLKADEYEDSEFSSEYLKIFTEDEGFSDICEAEDEKSKKSYGVKAYDYYYGKYAVSEYLSKGVLSAIEVAKSSQEKGYTRHNPYFILLNDARLDMSATDREKIVSAAEEYVASFPEEERDRIRMEIGI